MKTPIGEPGDDCSKEGRKEGKKEGRKDGRKEGRKEGRNNHVTQNLSVLFQDIFSLYSRFFFHVSQHVLGTFCVL